MDIIRLLQTPPFRNSRRISCPSLNPRKEGKEEESKKRKGKKNKPPRKLVPALICVDRFSKYASVALLPLERKNKEHIAAGLMEALNEMGCYDKENGGKLPETIYSDRDGGLVANELQEYFKEKNIRHLTTLWHAPVAERTIRTIKALYYKRMDERKEEGLGGNIRGCGEGI